MLYNDIIIEILRQNKELKAPPSQKEIADILSITRQAIGGRIKDKTDFLTADVKRIFDYYNVNLQMLDTKENNEVIADYIRSDDCSCSEQYDIAYWEDLPEDLKKVDFSSCHVDKEVMENYWKLDYNNIRVLPIFTKQLTYYPEERFPYGEIALMDISSTDIIKAGVYCFTTNSGIFIRALNLLYDGSVQFIDYTDIEPKISKTVPAEKLKEVNFNVVGRVFKCVTSRI